MIYVECYPDQTLVRVVTDLRLRDVPHEFKGKSAVVHQVVSRKDSQGLVDEDPLSVQPTRLSELPVIEDEPDLGLRLRGSNRSRAKLIILCPRLEEWIYEAATESDVDPRDFGLPERAADFKKQINHDLRRERTSRFERLLRELIIRQSPRLVRLRQMILD